MKQYKKLTRGAGCMKQEEIYDRQVQRKLGNCYRNISSSKRCTHLRVQCRYKKDVNNITSELREPMGSSFLTGAFVLEIEMEMEEMKFEMEMEMWKLKRGRAKLSW